MFHLFSKIIEGDDLLHLENDLRLSDIKEIDTNENEEILKYGAL